MRIAFRRLDPNFTGVAYASTGGSLIGASCVTDLSRIPTGAAAVTVAGLEL